MKLRAGDWIEIKSKEEILATLDKNGQLEGLPFMPQMFRYCGKRFKIYKRGQGPPATDHHDALRNPRHDPNSLIAKA